MQRPWSLSDYLENLSTRSPPSGVIVLDRLIGSFAPLGDTASQQYRKHRRLCATTLVSLQNCLGNLLTKFPPSGVIALERLIGSFAPLCDTASRQYRKHRGLYAKTLFSLRLLGEPRIKVSTLRFNRTGETDWVLRTSVLILPHGSISNTEDVMQRPQSLCDSLGNLVTRFPPSGVIILERLIWSFIFCTSV
jgi:hypothetical protein